MVNRKRLFEILKQFLLKEELSLMKGLLNNVKYSVRYENKMGKEFTTNTGVPQGDCLSAIMFNLYLAKALDGNINLFDHNYSNTGKPLRDPDHTYSLNHQSTQGHD